jgi:homoaconitase/3-isopropylmalate dehydratase large subunit
MNTLLQSLLVREQAQRRVDQDVREAEQAAAADIVAALHSAIAPFHDQIQAIKLRGDYGRAVLFGGRAEHLCRVACETGLKLHLGSTIQPAVLSLAVMQGQDGTPARTRLHVQYSHSSKSDELATFEAAHSAEDMVRALLEALMRHVHDESLVVLAEAA